MAPTLYPVSNVIAFWMGAYLLLYGVLLEAAASLPVAHSYGLELTLLVPLIGLSVAVSIACYKVMKLRVESIRAKINGLLAGVAAGLVAFALLWLNPFVYRPSPLKWTEAQLRAGEFAVRIGSIVLGTALLVLSIKRKSMNVSSNTKRDAG
jgi:hypothetical protein